MNINKLYEQFIIDSKSRDIHQLSDITYKNRMDTFQLFLKMTGIDSAYNLNTDLMRRFIKKGIDERNWKNSTVRSHLYKLSPFFKWLQEQGYIAQNYIEDLGKLPSVSAKMPDYYTEEEVDHIFAAIDIEFSKKFTRLRNRVMVAVLLTTGIRKGELLGMKMADIDMQHGFIHIQPENAKNRAYRAVQISPSLRRRLVEYFDERECMGAKTQNIWISENGYRLTKDGFQHVVNRLSKRLGYRFKPHKCRHTFSINFYRGSKDILALQKVLGHKKLETVMIYTMALDDDVRKSIEMNPLNHLI